MKGEQVKELFSQFRNNFSDFTADAEKEALEGLEQLMRQDPERDVDFMAFANLINSVSSPAIKNLNLIGIEQGLKMRIHGLEKQLEECESRLKEYQRKNIILQGDLREARNHHNNESSLPSDVLYQFNSQFKLILLLGPIRKTSIHVYDTASKLDSSQVISRQYKKLRQWVTIPCGNIGR